MNQTFSKIKGISVEPVSCPLCGGNAEWISLNEENFVMRCSQCHASTPSPRHTPEEAAADWNAHDICDNHFTITSDTKIDKYLKSGVKEVLFKECSGDENNPCCEDGFLCSEAVICTESITLCIKPQKAHLIYDEIADYNRDNYKRPIAPQGAEIKFLRSRWRRSRLLYLKFRYGDTRITLTPNKECNCMVVTESKIERFEKDREWRYAVVGNITKTHIDEQGILRYGSAAFCGGTKVYLCGKYWSKECGTISVIGLSRFKQHTCSDVSSELIENVRCQRAYKPYVLQLMGDFEFDDCWWGKTAEDKADTQRFVDYWKSEVEKR